jgi:hypothetical protein
VAPVQFRTQLRTQALGGCYHFEFALFSRETKFLVKKNNKLKKRFSCQKVESTFCPERIFREVI